MPIASPSSYLPTLDEFSSHWIRADAALGAAGPILLAGGMNLAGLDDLRAELMDRRAHMDAIRNEMERTRSDINRGKAALLHGSTSSTVNFVALRPAADGKPCCPKSSAFPRGPAA